MERRLLALPDDIRAAPHNVFVARIPSPSGLRTLATGGVGTRITPGGLLIATNNSLKDLIETAYDLKGFQITGARNGRIRT